MSFKKANVKYFFLVVLFVLLLVPNSAILAGHEHDLRRVPENVVSLKLGHVGRLAKPVHGFSALEKITRGGFIGKTA